MRAILAILLRTLLALIAITLLVWIFNLSIWIGPAPDSHTRLIAHRGVHQTFSRDGVGSDTCTASRIEAPTHDFLENTLPSMAEAFSFDADIVELDIHPTPDGKFAVFHDWTLDCRTNGSGVTRQTPMSVLKTLDIGHGYTADSGRTFPFQGKGIGMMPELEEVLTAFPSGRFLVNFKSNNPAEGNALAELLKNHQHYRKRVWAVYGVAKPVDAARAHIPGLQGFSKQQTKSCLKAYIILGWSGFVPEACHNTIISVPVSHAKWLWGWPHRFTKRLHNHGSSVILLGPHRGSTTGSTGIDSMELLQKVPARFDGLVWTNKIELIGPAFYALQKQEEK